MPEHDGDSALIFGNYEVLRGSDGKPAELGRGGFGCTYQARHRFLGKEVALKVIHERLAGDESAKRRFLKEAREHSALEHPGIVRLTDFGEAEGTFFYAMELCPGGDLKEYVQQRGPLPPDEALGLIRQTAEALRFAHARGIMHLDVKPSNLLLVRSGEGLPVVKLIDFGLVKRLVKTEADETVDHLSASLWSATFASPEQIMEQPLDESTDIFSLGMTAWFLMEGTGPVEGAPMQIVQERLNSASYEARLPASLTGALRGVVARMLEKDPKLRYRTCDEFLAALDQVSAQTAEEEMVLECASLITPPGPLLPLADRFLLETAESEFVFTGYDHERQMQVRIMLLDNRNVTEVQAKLRCFPAAPPAGRCRCWK